MSSLIFGGVATEHLQLNENTLYSDEPGKRDVKLDVTKDFDRIVAMLRQRQYAEATEFGVCPTYLTEKYAKLRILRLIVRPHRGQ